MAMMNDPNKKLIIPGLEDTPELEEDAVIEIDGDVIPVEMEDGTTVEFVVMARLEYEGELYLAMITKEDIEVMEDEFNFELTFAHMTDVEIDEDGDESFAIEPVEDEKLANILLELFREKAELEISEEEN